MLSITTPRVATGQPGPLRSAVGVANEVIWPCGRALCSAPVRAIAWLGVALGLRTRRRPMVRKISGRATGHPKPVWKPNALQGLQQNLQLTLATASSWLHGLAPNVDRTVQIVNVQGEEAASENVVEPGSYYQNEYMTLWNDSNDPVSAVLHVISNGLFELTVDNLDSINGGSCGKIVFRSGYVMSDIPGHPHRKRLQLKLAKDVKALEYDEALFERPARMALGFLKRASWMLASAFEMEFDISKNTVTAGPRAAVLKPFWQKMVELRPTSPAELWTWEATQSVQVEHAYANASLVTA